MLSIGNYFRNCRVFVQFISEKIVVISEKMCDLWHTCVRDWSGGAWLLGVKYRGCLEWRIWSIWQKTLIAWKNDMTVFVFLLAGLWQDEVIFYAFIQNNYFVTEAAKFDGQSFQVCTAAYSGWKYVAIEYYLPQSKYSTSNVTCNLQQTVNQLLIDILQHLMIK